MSTDLQTLKLAVVLTKEVLDAREILEKSLSEVNEIAAKENLNARYADNILFCEEQTAAGDPTEWTQFFNYKTPSSVIEQVSQKHEPDLIICVFWKLFGSSNSEENSETDSQLTVEQITAESKSFFINWLEENRSRLRIFFSDKEKGFDKVDEAKRLFVQYLRVSLYDKRENLWHTYKKNSSLQKMVVEELYQFIKGDASPEPPPPLELDLPDGWLYLNRYLRANRLSEEGIRNEDLQDFFDGMRPSFEIVGSNRVPRRSTVKQLQAQMNEAAKNKRHRVTLLRGPGGEGKSTILLQLAVGLANQPEPNFQVIYRRNKNVPLKRSFIEYLLKYKSAGQNANRAFVIVLDDAHTVAKDVFESAELIIHRSYNSPNSIQFLLASQGTEWQWRKVPPDGAWGREFGESNFVIRDVKRLEEKDAKEIVEAWDKAGALGKLKEIEDSEERWKYFYNSATDAVVKDESLNSFYGAILDVRRNQTLEGYVEAILERLNERRSLNGKSLKHYFAYIVALHGDGFQLLRKKILQLALGCSEEQFNEEILIPLKDEKVTWGEDEFILARHDVVAATAKRFYEKESRTFFHRIIAELAIAAERYHAQKPSEIPEIGVWRKMPQDYFFDLHEKSLALYIAEQVARELGDDPVAIGLWANLLRKNNEKEKAARVFSELYKKETSDKGYFTEWGVSLGNTGCRCLNIWLVAIALSDYATEREDRLEPPLLRLSSLASAFSRLLEQTLDSRNIQFYNPTYSSIFKTAIEGIVRLGRDSKAKTNAKLKYDYNKSMTNLDRELQRVSSRDVSGMFLDEAFRALMNGINLAWELRGLDKVKLPESLPAPSQISFNELKATFGIKTNFLPQTPPINAPGSRNEQKQAYKKNKFPFVFEPDSIEIFDAEGYKPNLSEDLLNVLKSFFIRDGEGVKSKLTFSEIASIYKRQTIYDEEKAKEEANNFARNLRRQLEEKYGVDDKDEIIKSWFGNGFQIGKNLIQGKGKYKNRDAVADRPNKQLSEAFDYEAD